MADNSFGQLDLIIVSDVVVYVDLCLHVALRPLLSIKDVVETVVRGCKTFPVSDIEDLYHSGKGRF